MLGDVGRCWGRGVMESKGSVRDSRGSKGSVGSKEAQHREGWREGLDRK
jgi:hypothetical protein